MYDLPIFTCGRRLDRFQINLLAYHFHINIRWFIPHRAYNPSRRLSNRLKQIERYLKIPTMIDIQV